MSSGFAGMMDAYRQAIDMRLQAYSEQLLLDTKKQYGDHAAIAVDAYCALLSRGGKRIRGALVMNAYAMCGGKDQKMILDAACAVEMMHAYILAIDDIQDRSDLRRGGLTAHKIIEQVSSDLEWRGDGAHTGISLALNGALIGAHFAENIFADLAVDADIKLEALRLMNTTMIITAHGQSGDIVNEVNGEVTEDDIEAVVLRKTAHYTILNPMQIGIVLAGGSKQETQSVARYAMAVGRAFQITDDLLTYSDKPLDKDPAIDIKDGKITLIMLHALQHAEVSDVAFLRRALGNHDLSQDEYEKCIQIAENTGSVKRAKQLAKDSIALAIDETRTFPTSWNENNVGFLQELATYILHRSN